MPEVIPFHQIRTNNKSLTLGVKHYVQEQLEPLLSANAHRHNMHEILIVTKGKAEQTVDMERYWIAKNSLCLIARGQVHNYHYFEDFEIWGIFFLEDMLPENLSGLILSLFSLQSKHHFVLSSEEVVLLEPLIKDMNNLLDKDDDDYAKEEILQHYLSALLLHIERLRRKHYKLKEQKKFENYELAQSFLALLEAYAKEQHNVSFYAELLKISSRKLSEISLEVLGKRGKMLIEEHLNLEAKRLLRFTSLSAQNVAYELGFDDPSYFTKFFKKYNGVAPSQFRHNN